MRRAIVMISIKLASKKIKKVAFSGMLTDPVGDSEEARENRRKHAEQRSHVAERLKGILEDIVA